MSTIAQHLEDMAAYNRVRFSLAERSIQIQRAGSHFKARYKGRSDFAFGATRHEARSRVKMFAGGTSKRSPVFKEGDLYE